MDLNMESFSIGNKEFLSNNLIWKFQLENSKASLR